jgi:hypothetical protein
MANALRGETILAIGGVDYTFHYSINALCEVEAETGLSVALLGEQLVRGYVGAMRALVWAGLRRHHACSLEEAGELTQTLVSEAGIEEAAASVARAFQAAFPDPEPQAEAETKPGKKKDGSGTTS